MQGTIITLPGRDGREHPMFKTWLDWIDAHLRKGREMVMAQDWDEARRLIEQTLTFARAIRADSELRCTPWSARARCAYARALMARSDLRARTGLAGLARIDCEEAIACTLGGIFEIEDDDDPGLPVLQELMARLACRKAALELSAGDDLAAEVELDAALRLRERLFDHWIERDETEMSARQLQGKIDALDLLVEVALERADIAAAKKARAEIAETRTTIDLLAPEEDDAPGADA